MKVPARTPGVFMRTDNPIGKAKTATLLFDVIADPGQVEPLQDEAVELQMIKLMLAAMAHNECPSEQYERLGLIAPTRSLDDNGDYQITLPEDDVLRQCCVLGTAKGQADAEHGGVGLPKMPFRGGQPFPDNLRLRDGYKFSQS